MVKKIFVCLTLALSCDDDCELAASCRTPEDFGECPADTLMRPRVCKTASCNIDGFDSEAVGLFIDFSTCDFPDCFTANCEITERSRNTFEVIAIHDGVFDLEGFPMGTVSVDGADPVGYSSGLLHADVCR